MQILSEDKNTISGGINLEAYFQRIGFTGEMSSDLASLQEIQLKHPVAIPFENLNPLLRRPVRLDLDSLQEKLILNGRGGYCFEHNVLLKHVLQTLGFTVKRLAGRVVWNLPEGQMNARTHMILLVEVGGEFFIADAGFGKFTLTAPLRLVQDLEQLTPHGLFRLIREEQEWVLQFKIEEEWKPLYRFMLDEQFDIDYEVANWYTSAHPDSHFTKVLTVARTSPEGRFVLRNRDFSIYYLDGRIEKKVLGSTKEMKEMLRDVFLLKLPQGPEMEEVLQRALLQ